MGLSIHRDQTLDSYPVRNPQLSFYACQFDITALFSPSYPLQLPVVARTQFAYIQSLRHIRSSLPTSEEYTII